MAQLEIRTENGKIYSFIRDKWLIKTPEEEVRQKFVCVLVNEFGYSINQMGEEIVMNLTRRGTGSARADIVIWKSEQDKADECGLDYSEQKAKNAVRLSDNGVLDGISDQVPDKREQQERNQKADAGADEV